MNLTDKVKIEIIKKSILSALSESKTENEKIIRLLEKKTEISGGGNKIIETITYMQSLQNYILNEKKRVEKFIHFDYSIPECEIGVNFNYLDLSINYLVGKAELYRLGIVHLNHILNGKDIDEITPRLSQINELVGSIEATCIQMSTYKVPKFIQDGKECKECEDEFEAWKKEAGTYLGQIYGLTYLQIEIFYEKKAENERLTQIKKSELITKEKKEKIVKNQTKQANEKQKSEKAKRDAYYASIGIKIEKKGRK